MDRSNTRGIVYKMKYDYGYEEEQSSGTSPIYLTYVDRAYFPFCTAETDK
jgi:hypothetical protein